LNDLHRLNGLEAVERAIARPASPQVSTPQLTGKNTVAAILGACGGFLRRGDSITPEPVSWVWDGWLAAGKFHVLAGQPGTGKTTLALAFAATITAGCPWARGTRGRA